MFNFPYRASRSVLLCAAASLTLATTPLLAAQSGTADDSNSASVISVNGVRITSDMFTIFYQRTVPEKIQAEQKGELSKEERTALLDQLVNYIILSQEAKKQGLDKRDEVKAGLQLVEAEYLANVVLGGEAAKNPITDKELKELYDEQAAKPPEQEYRARHILLNDQATASRMVAELNTGADFQALAKKYSTGPSAPKGGELPWFGKGQMVPEFEEAVARLKPGKWTQSPVKTQFGWHVILLEESRNRTLPPFETMKGSLLQHAQRMRLSRYLSKLRETADIKVLSK